MLFGVLQSDDAYNPERMYDLVAVVVHIGSSLNRGHYISIVKSEDIWILFDDDLVDVSTYMYIHPAGKIFIFVQASIYGFRTLVFFIFTLMSLPVYTSSAHC